MVSTRSFARGSAVCLTLALALAAAACSKSSSPPGSIATTPIAPVQSPASSSPSGETAAVTVSQTNYQFSPANLSVNQGDTIAGKGVDVVNDAGQTQTVTIDLPPGTYPFICRFHSSLGMKGTLTVK